MLFQLFNSEFLISYF